MHAAEVLKEFSAEVSVIVITFGLREGATKWLSETGCECPMLIDQPRKIYRTFGLKRSLFKVWSISSLVYYAEKMIEGVELPRPYENVHDDLQQMGGDFIIDKDGIVRFMYPSKMAYDRPALDLLKEAMKKI
ncbi:hypothetical protein ScPMuIL_014187 [Solemya velum]